MKCEGSCEEHKGEVVEVTSGSWGKFFYCETAIEEDRRRGLEVVVVGEESEEEHF